MIKKILDIINNKIIIVYFLFFLAVILMLFFDPWNYITSSVIPGINMDLYHLEPFSLLHWPVKLVGENIFGQKYFDYNILKENIPSLFLIILNIFYLFLLTNIGYLVLSLIFYPNTNLLENPDKPHFLIKYFASFILGYLTVIPINRVVSIFLPNNIGPFIIFSFLIFINLFLIFFDHTDFFI